MVNFDKVKIGSKLKVCIKVQPSSNSPIVLLKDQVIQIFNISKEQYQGTFGTWYHYIVLDTGTQLAFEKYSELATKSYFSLLEEEIINEIILW